MFDKLKQGRDLLKMRNQVMDMQKKLAEVTDTADEGTVHVKVSADKNVIFVSIDGEERKDIVKAINKAFKSVEKKAQQKMVEEGGLGALFGAMGK